jgi:dTDP-4-amino-4,6-dideoxygalactose transaminase
VESMSSEKIIRLSKSCIGEAEKRAVLGVLDREYLGMGVEVQKFEQALTDFFGRPAVCVGNGTAALQLALQACGIGCGDEVLVQSLTYVASFQAISATGAVPIPCDISPDTLTLDWQDAEKRLTKNTKAVMPVHYAGGVGALDEIYAFARKHSLRVVEDAAHAFGSLHKGKLVGSFGDIACFSFDGIKNITSGEGGCIVTNDNEVLKQVRDIRLLGVERDTEMRFSGNRSWEFDVKTQGWRYHMSNIMAAIGSVQLDRMSEMANKRKSLAQLYQGLLQTSSFLDLINCDYQEVVPHIFPIRVVDERQRDSLRESLRSGGIETGIHYMPNHLLSKYKLPETANLLRITDQVHKQLVTLPLHPDLSDSDVVYVVDSVKKCFSQQINEVI